MRDIHDAVEEGDMASVVSFLDKQPDLINYQPFGESPLHIAVQQGKMDIVRLLLERGAAIDLPGNNGLTPLHLASARGKHEIADLLLQYNPNVERLDDYGFSPLLTAAKKNEREVAKLLIDHGAIYDLNSAVCLGDINKVRQSLASDPNIVDRSRFKKDLLADAVYAHLPELVELLLSQPGINPNHVSSSGEPPLVAAVSRNDYSSRIVELLLKHGANPLEQSSSGDNALDRALLVGISDAKQLFKLS